MDSCKNGSWGNSNPTSPNSYISGNSSTTSSNSLDSNDMLSNMESINSNSVYNNNQINNNNNEYLLWVTNIENNVKVEKILQLFSYCGNIKSILFKNIDNNSKGALIKFDNQIALDTAMLLDKAIVGTKSISTTNDLNLIPMDLIQQYRQQLTPGQMKDLDVVSSPTNSDTSSGSSGAFSDNEQVLPTHSNDLMMMDELSNLPSTNNNDNNNIEKTKLKTRIKQFIKGGGSSSKSPITGSSSINSPSFPTNQ